VELVAFQGIEKVGKKVHKLEINRAYKNMRKLSRAINEFNEGILHRA
jgi:hypothetical protein